MYLYACSIFFSLTIIFSVSACDFNNRVQLSITPVRAPGHAPFLEQDDVSPFIRKRKGENGSPPSQVMLWTSLPPP